MPSTSRTGPNFAFKASLNVRSSTATRDSARCIIAPPGAERAAQRRIEATASAARTGDPSWKRMPSRRRKVQVIPSSLRVQVSTICGLGSNLESIANSTS